MKKYPEKALTLGKALNLLRIEGHCLMLLHSNSSPAGKAYYVVPGGYVAPDDAMKIIRRDDVRPFDEGLFPGCTQSWRMGG